MTQTPAQPIEAILPLGRLPVPADGGAAELRLLNRRPLLDWALEEAVQARASRILLVAAADYAPAAALLDHARRAIKAMQTRPDQPMPDLDLILPDRTDPASAEGWDRLVRLAALQCKGPSALLIDPAMPLLRGRQVVTYASFMLCRAATTLPPAQPLLAHAALPWDRAIALPVLVPRGKRLRFRFDRSLRGDTVTVFAGRALLRLPLPPVETVTDSGWPQAYRFPFETLVRLLLGQGACGYPLDFTPVEHPAALPPDADPDHATRPPLVLRPDRAGLAALSEPAR